MNEVTNINNKVEETKNEEPVIIKEIPMEETKSNNNNNKLSFIIMIIGIIMALLGIILLIIPNLGEETLTANDFNGIYKNDNGEALLYSKDGKTVHVSIELEDYSFTHQSEVKDNKLNLEAENKKTIVSLDKNKKTVSIKSDIKELNNMTFKKEKEYSKEQFFNNNYGNSKYLDSKYNGIYKKDNSEIKMYQQYDDTVRVYISKENSSIDTEFLIKDENTIISELEEIEYKITIDGDKIQFETTKGDKEYDGEYKREKTLSQDEIMELFY